MLVMIGGRERTEAGYCALLNSADLKLARIIPTATEASVIEGDRLAPFASLVGGPLLSSESFRTLLD